MQELAGMKVYSLKDVCKLLKIGPQKGLELFNNNEFPAQRVGRSWWIEADAFKEFMMKRHDYSKSVTLK
ncbi:MAG: helix-turn-helix domain-containing protein [Clostridia bacterium]